MLVASLAIAFLWLAPGDAAAQTSCSASTETQLNDCITAYNASTTGTTTVTITTDIVIADDLAIISNGTSPAPRLIIDGGGHSIDGMNAAAVSNIVRMTDGDLSLVDVTLANSVGDGADFRGGPVLISGSTITGHVRGIFASSSDGVSIVNSTIAFNSDIGVEIGTGDSATIVLSTIARNGSFEFGDFGIDNSAGTVTLTDSILASNLGDDCASFLTNGGGNAVSDSTCTGTSALVGLASALADNGCTQPCTQTIAPSTQSASIDRAGSCSESVDQRGMPRTNGLCDAGAYEAGDCTEVIDVSNATELSYAAGCYGRILASQSLLINVTQDIAADSDAPFLIFVHDTATPPAVLEGNGHTIEVPLEFADGNFTVRNVTLAPGPAAVAIRILPTSMGGASLTLEHATVRDALRGLRLVGDLDSSLSASVLNSTFVGNLVGVEVCCGEAFLGLTGVTIIDSERGAIGPRFVDDGFLTIQSSLIARSAIADCEGIDIAFFDSVASDATCNGTATSGLDTSVSTTLAANGCSDCPFTAALLEGSGAIDAGGDCSLTVDQRGADRDDGACDAGAYEFQQAPPQFCNGQVVTVDIGAGDTPTSGDDVILGTGGADVIDALEGNDVVCALGGNDEVVGGDGDDTIFGGVGNDRLFGRQGFDTIHGEAGDDTIHGNRGDDTLTGGAGDDRIFGYAHNDTIDGGEGNDRLHGNFGDDVITGGVGDDRMFGYGDDDTMHGGSGDDLMSGNFGDDTINGDGGNDTIFGADGDDVVSGGADDDIVNGNSLNDIVNGNGGNDTLDGGIGVDTCNGNAGTDTASRCETVTGVP